MNSHSFDQRIGPRLYMTFNKREERILKLEGLRNMEKFDSYVDIFHRDKSEQPFKR